VTPNGRLSWLSDDDDGLAERTGIRPLSKAFHPSASGKVWLITVRSLPVSVISASRASSSASGWTMKNTARIRFRSARAWSGGALSVTSRPPGRSRL
jgi:hypothetical protein